MDRKQCIHVFEITRPECLICTGRDEKCREYKEHEEEQDESHDRAGSDAEGTAEMTRWVHPSSRCIRALALARRG